MRSSNSRRPEVTIPAVLGDLGAAAAAFGPVDLRVIAPEDHRYNATLLGRTDQTAQLARFLVRIDEVPDVPPVPGAIPRRATDPLAARPGQYVTIGIEADGQLVQRPYSPASVDPVARTVELYVRRVPLLRFTGLLWRLPAGHRLRVTGPRGLFLLDEADSRDHLFVASGTGIAPFVTMVRSLATRLAIPTPASRLATAVVLHGVSHARELGYRDWFERMATGSPVEPATGTSLGLSYVPSISRPADPANAGWSGSVGRVEAIVGPAFERLGLAPDHTVAYLCGNPDMIEAASATLAALGLPPEAIRSEHYWPKDRPPELAPSGRRGPS